MAQLMPLPLTVSCFSKIQTDFTFLVPAHLGSTGKGPLNGCVCVHYLKAGEADPVLTDCSALLARCTGAETRPRHWLYLRQMRTEQQRFNGK